jgi:succinyl-CoA synthetase beta subunit
MDIEQLRMKHRIKFLKNGFTPLVACSLSRRERSLLISGLKGEAFKNCVKFVTNLYNAYVGLDCSMLEINPFFNTSDDKIIAVDCKMNLDDNALMRHADLEALRDFAEEDPQK